MNKYPGDVKFYFKNFPLNIHKYAKKASVAALAAHKQGKFEAFHNKLFENHRTLNDKKVLEIAEELGLNMEAFNKDRSSASIKNLVNRDMMEGQKIGVRSTPSVFINGILLKRRNLKSFQLKIDAELKKAP
jgi:predicted DsbA family dithiol-disulfide isomerase